MILDMKTLEFENDFFSISLPNGGELILNCIDETIKSVDDLAVSVNRINMQINYREKDKQYAATCSSVIGLRDAFTQITTDYKEYVGKLLNKDNMRFCKVEIYE